MQRADVFKRTHACLLHHILGIVGIARQLIRHIVGRVNVGQDQRFETVNVRQANVPRFAA
jgi:hypothetical protein